MADVRWTGQALTDLLTLSASEVSLKYGLTIEGIYTKRKKIKRQARKIATLMEKDPSYIPKEHEVERMEAVALEDDRLREILEDFRTHGIPVDEADASKVERVTYWTQHSVDRETGEPVQVVNRYVRMKPTEQDDEADAEQMFPKAEVADIRPTRRARQKRLGQWIMAYGDMQIEYRRLYDPETGEDRLEPSHDEHALDIVHQIAADYMPEKIIDLGDPTDLAALSRFDVKHDNFHRTIGPSLQRTHNHFAQFRADAPDSELIIVDSNHAVRANNHMMSRMPELYGMTLPNETEPLMSLNRLASLSELGVIYVHGYGAAAYVHGMEYDAPPIIFKHGTHSSGSAGATVRKESIENPDANVVRGHGHSFEQVSRTTRDGWQLRYMQLGATCLTGGQVEGYHSAVDQNGHPVHYQENWQKQALMIRDYGNGMYEWHVIDIKDGVAYFNGIRYESRYIDEEQTPRLYKAK